MSLARINTIDPVIGLKVIATTDMIVLIKASFEQNLRSAERSNWGSKSTGIALITTNFSKLDNNLEKCF